MKKYVSLILVIALALTSFVGCKKNEEKEVSASPITYSGEDIYPVKCDDTLTFWMKLNSVLSQSVSNFGDSALGQELYKQTGIKVEFIHPAQGGSGDQFSLLLASNDLPDIMENSWLGFGGQKAINSKYIIELNDVIDKWAPNLKKAIEDNPKMEKMIKTDEGSYYAFPFWRGEEYLCTFMGPIIRKDWLDKLGMEVPETIDEWEKMLIAFKDELGVKVPLSFNGSFFGNGFFSGAYGAPQNFFLGDDGKIKYGPLEPEFKDFLMRMNKWYKMGLLDEDIVAAPKSEVLMMNNECGAIFGFVGGGIGSILENMTVDNKEFDLVGAKYPVLKKGDKPEFGQLDCQYGSTSYAISAQCKNVELAARLLDFGYGEQGGLLYNFGVEGESYEFVDGEPKYTDKILNDPDGATIDNMIARFNMAGSSGPFIHDRRAVDQTRPFPQQREAVENWSFTNMSKHQIPPITHTAEEADRLSNILSEVNTFILTDMYAYIIGTKSFDEYDSFVKQIKKFGIDEVLDIKNAALERYNNR